MTDQGKLAEFRSGWRELTAATLGVGAGVAIVPAYTNGLVVTALEAEFGWTRSQQSLLPLVAALVLILASPVVGLIADRWGVRWPPVLGMAVLGGGYFVLAASGPSFPIYLMLFGLMYLLASPSTAVTLTRAVTARFDRARGLALGISLSGAGLVIYLIPRLLGDVLASDWRHGYRLIGTAVLICATVVLVLMPAQSSRHSVSEARQTSVPRKDSSAGLSIVPLIRKSLFVRLSAAFLLLNLGVGWIALFLVALLRDAGMSAHGAAEVASLIGISMIVSRIAVGVLVDRFFAPRVGAGIIACAALGLIALLVGGPSLSAGAAIATGAALGAEFDLAGNLTSRYYPTAFYSRIFGVFYSVLTIGVGFGPLLASELRDVSGGYQMPLIVSTVCLLLASLLLATAPAYPVAAKDSPSLRDASAGDDRIAGLGV